MATPQIITQVPIPPEPYQRVCEETPNIPGVLVDATTLPVDFKTNASKIVSLNNKKCTLTESNTEIPENQVDFYNCQSNIDVVLFRNHNSTGNGLLRLWVENAKPEAMNYEITEIATGEILLTVTKKKSGPVAKK